MSVEISVMRCCLSPLLDEELRAVKGIFSLIFVSGAWGLPVNISTGIYLANHQIFNENLCLGTGQPLSLSSCSTLSAGEKTSNLTNK